MSLTDKKIEDTKYELKSNFEKSGLSIDENIQRLINLSKIHQTAV